MLKGKWYNFILLGVVLSACFLKFGNFSWLELYFFGVFSVIILLLNSRLLKNLNTYIELLLLLFGVFALKMSTDYHMSADISKIWVQFVEIIPFLILFVFTLCYKGYKDDKKFAIKQREWKNYFAEREDDLKRLEQIVG